MFTFDTSTDHPACCKCAQAIESETKCLVVDEHSIVCDECYRIMLASDYRPSRMEGLD